MKRIYITKLGQKPTPEMLKEVEEAKKYTIVFDEDCEELSPEMIKAFKCVETERGKRISMHRAVAVKPMKNHLLFVRFDNGEERIFNCLTLLRDKLFSDIADVNFYNKVHIDEMGLVCWDEATDINPYDLYEKSESLLNFVFEG